MSQLSVSIIFKLLSIFVEPKTFYPHKSENGTRNFFDYFDLFEIRFSSNKLLYFVIIKWNCQALLFGKKKKKNVARIKPNKNLKTRIFIINNYK